MAPSVSLPRATWLRNAPRRAKRARSCARAAASSLTHSAMRSRAPARASSTVGTPRSTSTNAPAASAGSKRSCGSWAKRRRASGSRPRSRAMVARVRRLGRYGRYRSSRTLRVGAARRAAASSSVSSSRSARDETIARRRLSSSASCARRSRIAATATSSSDPVASLRYREMNGTVPPSSSSCGDGVDLRGPHAQFGGDDVGGGVCLVIHGTGDARRTPVRQQGFGWWMSYEFREGRGPAQRPDSVERAARHQPALGPSVAFSSVSEGDRGASGRSSGDNTSVSAMMRQRDVCLVGWSRSGQLCRDDQEGRGNGHGGNGS